MKHIGILCLMGWMTGIGISQGWANSTHSISLTQSTSFTTAIKKDFQKWIGSWRDLTKQSFLYTMSDIPVQIDSSPRVFALYRSEQGIVISLGLMQLLHKQAQNEREFFSMFSFILAHEIGHVFQSGKMSKSTEKQEEISDIVGAIGLLSMGLDETAPVRLFQIMNRANVAGFSAKSIQKREYAYLKNLAELKKEAIHYQAALAAFYAGDKRVQEDVIGSLMQMRNNLIERGFEALPWIDYAMATLYHKMWLTHGNHPGWLMVQSSVETPRELFRYDRAGSLTQIPGKLYYFYQSSEHYEQAARANLFSVNPSLALPYISLLMYEPKQQQRSVTMIEKWFMDNHSSLDKLSLTDLNNAAAVYLYLSKVLPLEKKKMIETKEKKDNDHSQNTDRAISTINLSRASEQINHNESFFLKRAKFILETAARKQAADKTNSILVAGDIQNKLRYHQALYYKATNQTTAFRKTIKQIKQNDWLAVEWGKLLDETWNESFDNKVKIVPLSEAMPFAIGASLEKIKEDLSRLDPQLQITTKEAGGWLFLFAKKNNIVQSRFLFILDKEKQNQQWFMVKATLSASLVRQVLAKQGLTDKQILTRYTNQKVVLSGDNADKPRIIAPKDGIELILKRTNTGYLIRELSYTGWGEE